MNFICALYKKGVVAHRLTMDDSRNDRHGEKRTGIHARTDSEKEADKRRMKQMNETNVENETKSGKAAAAKSPLSDHTAEATPQYPALVGKRVARRLGDKKIHYGTIIGMVPIPERQWDGVPEWRVEFEGYYQDVDYDHLMRCFTLYASHPEQTVGKDENEATATPSCSTGNKTQSYVERRVARRFRDNKVFCGTITHVYPSSETMYGKTLWRVLYDVGKWELLDHSELRQGLSLFEDGTPKTVTPS